MKKIIISTLSALAMGLTGSSYATTLDAQTLTKALQRPATISNQGEFAIVYGGQDISRGSINLHDAKVYQPILVG